MAAPMFNYGSSIVFLTNPENELFKMELTFRGLAINDKTGEPYKVGEPLMNEQGIKSVLGLVQSIVNQVTIFGNLSKNEIPLIMMELSDTLDRDLMVNKINYAIGKTIITKDGRQVVYYNPSVRDRIAFMVTSQAFICLSRAKEGDDKRFWKGAVQEIQTTYKDERQSGGLMNKLLGWGK